MRGWFLVWLVACGDGSHFQQLPGMPNGFVRAVVFDDDDLPIVWTDVGVARWDGSRWVDLPTDGLPAETFSGTRRDTMSRGPSGELFAVVADEVFRLESGSARWELFSQGLPRDTVHTVEDILLAPVAASDGSLFTVRFNGNDRGDIWYRTDLAAAWIDPKIETAWPVFPALPQPDDSGNIWIGPQRIDQAGTEQVSGLQRLTTFAVVGSQHYAFGQALIRFGEFVVWTPEAGISPPLGSEPMCGLDDCGIILTEVAAPDGTLYQIRAPFTSERSQLLQLAPGAPGWTSLGASDAIFHGEGERLWMGRGGTAYVTGKTTDLKNRLMYRVVE